MLGFFNKVKNFNDFKAKKHAVSFSGALVFFTVLGLVPTVYLLSLCFALFGSKISETFTVFNFEEFSDIKDFLLETTQKLSTGGNVIAGLISVYSSANLFFHLKLTGEVVYNHESTDRLFIRIISIIGTVILSLITAFAFVIYAFISVYITKIAGAILGALINYSVLFLIILFAVVFINVFSCPYKIKIREVLRGSLYTCIFSFIFTLVFVFYVKYFSSYSQIYGKIASIPVFLAWLFIVMRCMVTGFLINAYTLGKTKTKKIDLKHSL